MSARGGTGVVVYRMTGGIDAIDEYSRRLVAAMVANGTKARYTADGLHSVLATNLRPSWVLLQYNPFSYGRWGVAPGLVHGALQLRRAGVPLAIMVHEAWPAMTDWRTTLMGLWQRAQLRALLRLAGTVLTSTEALSRVVRCDAVHVPVATNVSPAATTPEEARRAVGMRDGLVVAMFGRNHWTRDLDLAAAALTAIVVARGTQPTTVLNLGADAPALDLPLDVDVRTPGVLSEHALSLHLWASDMLLLPFTDGVSTRRTTLMAALAHGRPVVGLSGSNTDAMLLANRQAITLTPVGDVDAFVRAAVALAGDPARRRAAGEASRGLFDAEFDWPRLAARVMSAIEPILSPGSRTATTLRLPDA
jgi:glycosyltransferase involved in cell wall biosynthesis